MQLQFLTSIFLAGELVREIRSILYAVTHSTAVQKRFQQPRIKSNELNDAGMSVRQAGPLWGCVLRLVALRIPHLI